MKAIEQIFDIGLGVLVLCLVLSTAYFGLYELFNTNTYAGLEDKNAGSVSTNIKLSINVPNKSLQDIAFSLVSSTQDTDNVRQLKIIIKAPNDANDNKVEQTQSLASLYDDVVRMIQSAMNEYKGKSTHGENITNGKYKSFVAANQSNVICYILVE